MEFTTENSFIRHVSLLAFLCFSQKVLKPKTSTGSKHSYSRDDKITSVLEFLMERFESWASFLTSPKRKSGFLVGRRYSMNSVGPDLFGSLKKHKGPGHRPYGVPQSICPWVLVQGVVGGTEPGQPPSSHWYLPPVITLPRGPCQTFYI